MAQCVCVGMQRVMGMSEGWRYINEINGVKSREVYKGGQEGGRSGDVLEKQQCNRDSVCMCVIDRGKREIVLLLLRVCTCVYVCV